MQKGMFTTTHEIPSGRYHAIVGSDILHHVDLDHYLDDMNKKLKKGGVIIFSEPNIFNIAWIVLITLVLDWRIEWRIIHCNYISLRRKLNQNKYRNITIQGFGLFPPPLLNKTPFLQKVNYFLGDIFLLKFFAYRYIIQAEKG
jgi:hypothetical protein